MSKMKIALFLLFGLTANAVATGPSSDNYNAQVNTFDAGGLLSTSANYSNDGSVGGFGGLVTAQTSPATNRTGYAGQLYEVTAFTLTAPSNKLNEAASMPLSAVQFLDDGTVSSASTFAQWSFSGPIAGVNAAGIVTAANVNQDTPAMVQACFEGWSASLNLTVLDVVVLPGFNQLSSQFLGGNRMRLSYVGSNGISYALDRSYNLAPPANWIPQITNLAGANGLLIFTNLANPTTNNFWRIRSVP